MVAIVEFQRFMTNASIFYIIISKFINWNYLYQVIIFIIDKSLEIDLYNTILILILAISLKIKGY